MDKKCLMQHDKQMLNKMESLCKALGDKNRLIIIKILASHKDYRPCVIDLAGNLGISQPATSQHLKILKNVGLVTAC